MAPQFSCNFWQLDLTLPDHNPPLPPWFPSASSSGHNWCLKRMEGCRIFPVQTCKTRMFWDIS